MSIPSLLPESLTVSEINRYLRKVMEEDVLLQDLWISGEISNLSRPSSGHIYFTLKDSQAALRCVIWRSAAARIHANMRDGMSIEAHGYISVYEQGGQYQLYADAIRLAGEGSLFQEFMRLKAQLEAEGLFDESRKRTLPEQPHIIGIVTSPTGAALQDMLNILRYRYPLAEVYISPTSVQGEAAPLEIVNALHKLNMEIHPDVILLGRGGGSLEDLWAFNDERVVRAVASSDSPVVTGIGHETDFTLCDFASDYRAPTPTGAAVSATPDIQDIKQSLISVNRHLSDLINTQLSGKMIDFKDQIYHLNRLSPEWKIQNAQQRLDEVVEGMNRTLSHVFQLHKARLESSIHSLNSLNPENVLQRGYAVLTKPDGKILNSIHQTSPGDQVFVQMKDGSLTTRIEEVLPSKNN